MFKEVWDIILYVIKKIVTSRLFIVVILFAGMFASLVWKLFDIQIVDSEKYQEEYIQKTLKTIQTPSTRGNIYDRNGNLLAYNQLTYSVTMMDTGAFKDGYERNKMLIELIGILDAHGETVVSAFPMTIDENGNLIFTTASEGEKNTLLKNIYGMTSEDTFDMVNSKGELYNQSNPDPEEFFAKAKHKFGIGEEPNKPDAYEVDDALALKMLHIRYAMFLKSYMRYDSTVIASNVSQETVTDILEHANELREIDVEEETIRVYNYAKYFAHIIGYTGKASDEELSELKEQDDTYELGDVVGKTGMEQVMEQSLSGTKGSQTMFLDSEGRILDILSQTDPIAGNNIYLSVDANLTVGIYHLLEQKLAGILSAKIIEGDFEITEDTDTSKIMIPVRDAYFQLINNNVLSLNAFSRPDASEVEQQIYASFTGRQATVLASMQGYLTSPGAAVYPALSEMDQDYIDYIYGYLLDENYLTVSDEIWKDPAFQNWYNRTVSFQEFLRYAVSANWIDVSKLNIDSKYATMDDTYQILVEHLMNELSSDVGFCKLVYKYLVDDGTVTGRQLCLSLFYQGVLAWDEEAVGRLNGGNSRTAYEFFMEKVRKIEITPEQLALDPCTASCVLLNVKTGEPLAVVTYPGYDNNYLSGTVNGSYYSTLIHNLSNPLYNNATQTRTAPGSIFKVISAIAGLEERVVSLSEGIEDEGIYTKQGMNLRCWIFPSNHGRLTVSGAIQNSCNYYFSEVGYRLSLDQNGNYNEPLGLQKIRQYASLFGLNDKSGLEISEIMPQISDTSPIASAIGQGSHAFSNVHLARYAAAVANRGTLYRLTLLSKRTDFEGNLLEEYASEVENQISIANSTWNAVQSGMREVIASGSATEIFSTCPVAVAGKTGTAEESDKRGPHATFIGFAPYEDPEISVSIMIPYGYASSYSTEVARDVLNYYYGSSTLEQILAQGAADLSGVTIGD
ncbi:MAG: penicillin-binding protein [Lachnospiraceae bacterium]|nr:penicillin-binding protein [Lachnospiraceae bacterium]